jgi:hypothetical protein
MAKRTNPVQTLTPQELERKAANREGEAKREKAKKVRQANAEKQRRYRDSMKARGYHAVLTWEKPLPPDMVKVSAIIHKNSRDIATREDTEPVRFIQHLHAEILSGYQKGKISKEIYRDIVVLLKPLGNDGL